MTDIDRVAILEVVDASGRRVLDGTGMQQFQVFEDGAFTGERGDVWALNELCGRPLHWRYGLVVEAETGEVMRREAVAGNGRK